MNNTQKEEELSLCSKCNTMKHIEIGNKECVKCVSESLEEKGEEIKMEDCQVCNQYICKCPVKEFTPPTDSNWEEELKKKFDCHQTGCSYRKKGKWIMIACDMNCYNIIVGFIANQISSTLQQERQREREKMIEEVEKLKLKSGKANRRGQHFINEDDYNDALDKVLDIIKNKE